MSYLGREAAKAPLVTADIPDNSITAAKIVDATIVAADLAPNSVDSSELVDGSIDTSHIGDNQVTLAKMAGGTDGNIISYDASGDPVAIATGDDGEVLTSTGAGSPPAFEAAPGGGLVFLATVTGSDTAGLVIDGVFTSDYTHYKFYYSMTGNTANTDVGLYVRHGSPGSNQSSTLYRYSATAGYHDENNGVAVDNHISDWDGSYMHIGSQDSAASTTHPVTGELTLYNALATDRNKTITGQVCGYNSTSPTPNAIRNWQYAGYYVSNTALSGLQFFHYGGNTTGTVSCYGIKNS